MIQHCCCYYCLAMFVFLIVFGSSHNVNCNGAHKDPSTVNKSINLLSFSKFHPPLSGPNDGDVTKLEHTMCACVLLSGDRITPMSFPSHTNAHTRSSKENEMVNEQKYVFLIFTKYQSIIFIGAAITIKKNRNEKFIFFLFLCRRRRRRHHLVFARR